MASGNKPVLDIISSVLSRFMDGLDEITASLDSDTSKFIPMLLELGLLEVHRIGGRSIYLTTAKGRVLLEEYELFKKNSSSSY